ncbi:hypothetical protein [Rothia sp. ZJ1223]|uniref:hypothetical protein n=1 Tax=Rothia sp. ZJ1223 TaxID=2811098 RepID=UPI00195EFED1|nr:hypothetical protein [Rothia sp. ZJ1223]MBM7051337.1 hypothetical protein [Rothia sp. ZJ1223]
MSALLSRFRALKKVGLAAAAVTVAAALAMPPASAYPDGPWFVAGKPYVTTGQWVPGHNITIGDLADPDVFQENGTYYAYGTSMGGGNVPLITSTDLKNRRPTSDTPL